MMNSKYIESFKDPKYINNILEQMLVKGYAELPEFVDKKTIENLISYSDGLGFNDPAIKRKAGTPAMDIARSDGFMAMFDSIHKARCQAEKSEYVRLNPLQQAVGFPRKDVKDQSATPFHFDDSYINVLLALKISTKESEGNLLVYPNFRKRIKPLIVSKIFARLIRHIPLVRMIFRPKVVRYIEGSLYLFFGDITLHGVTRITAGERHVMVVNASRLTPEKYDEKYTVGGN